MLKALLAASEATLETGISSMAGSGCDSKMVDDEYLEDMQSAFDGMDFRAGLIGGLLWA